jgi:hypothetical protein
VWGRKGRETEHDGSRRVRNVMRTLTDTGTRHVSLNLWILRGMKVTSSIASAPAHTHRGDSMSETEGRTGRPVLDLATPNLQGSGPVLRDEIKKGKERRKCGRIEYRGMKRCSGEGTGKGNEYTLGSPP